MTKADATKILNSSLKLVESDSIRAWARTPHNKPLFVDMIKRSGERDINWIAAKIVSYAIGL